MNHYERSHNERSHRNIKTFKVQILKTNDGNDNFMVVEPKTKRNSRSRERNKSRERKKSRVFWPKCRPKVKTKSHLRTRSKAHLQKVPIVMCRSTEMACDCAKPSKSCVPINAHISNKRNRQGDWSTDTEMYNDEFEIIKIFKRPHGNKKTSKKNSNPDRIGTRSRVKRSASYNAKPSRRESCKTRRSISEDRRQPSKDRVRPDTGECSVQTSKLTVDNQNGTEEVNKSRRHGSPRKQKQKRTNSLLIERYRGKPKSSEPAESLKEDLAITKITKTTEKPKKVTFADTCSYRTIESFPVGWEASDLGTPQSPHQDPKPTVGKRRRFKFSDDSDSTINCEGAESSTLSEIDYNSDSYISDKLNYFSNDEMTDTFNLSDLDKEETLFDTEEQPGEEILSSGRDKSVDDMKDEPTSAIKQSKWQTRRPRSRAMRVMDRKTKDLNPRNFGDSLQALRRSQQSETPCKEMPQYKDKERRPGMTRRTQNVDKLSNFPRSDQPRNVQFRGISEETPSRSRNFGLLGAFSLDTPRPRLTSRGISPLRGKSDNATRQYRFKEYSSHPTGPMTPRRTYEPTDYLKEEDGDSPIAIDEVADIRSTTHQPSNYRSTGSLYKYNNFSFKSYDKGRDVSFSTGPAIHRYKSYLDNRRFNNNK